MRKLTTRPLDLLAQQGTCEVLAAELTLTLPLGCGSLEAEVSRVGAVLVSIDPLMSAVAGGLDTHKDRDVRQALEPLAHLADRTGCTVLGNSHFNKSTGSDPCALIMGSSALGNVVRAAVGFALDPDADDGSGVISQVKNNLGRLDLPSLRYRIEEAFVPTETGDAKVGRLVMLGESERASPTSFATVTRRRIAPSGPTSRSGCSRTSGIPSMARGRMT